MQVMVMQMSQPSIRARNMTCPFLFVSYTLKMSHAKQ